MQRSYWGQFDRDRLDEHRWRVVDQERIWGLDRLLPILGNARSLFSLADCLDPHEVLRLSKTVLASVGHSSVRMLRAWIHDFGQGLELALDRQRFGPFLLPGGLDKKWHRRCWGVQRISAQWTLRSFGRCNLELGGGSTSNGSPDKEWTGTSPPPNGETCQVLHQMQNPPEIEYLHLG